MGSQSICLFRQVTLINKMLAPASFNMKGKAKVLVPRGSDLVSCINEKKNHVFMINIFTRNLTENIRCDPIS